MKLPFAGRIGSPKLLTLFTFTQGAARDIAASAPFCETAVGVKEEH
jgi:hypothetical protein